MLEKNLIIFQKLIYFFEINMPAKLALMLEISREKKYTNGLKIFHSQELLFVSLETRVQLLQYGGGEITRDHESLIE